MKHTVRVAACQMTVVDNPFVNCRTILRAIRSLPRRTDIVCFPETCINTNERRVVDVSVYLKSIAAACRAKRVHAIVGAYERERGRVYNVTYLFDHRGRVLHRYKKVHLWREELHCSKHDLVRLASSPAGTMRFLRIFSAGSRRKRTSFFVHRS